ncbi:pullulanase-type alpha-1,6-glucosidase [Sapientia aquatica]|nr:pullulanase-type alpha-1,6-glucosidase [Sapientia aquatica]
MAIYSNQQGIASSFGSLFATVFRTKITQKRVALIALTSFTLLLSACGGGGGGGVGVSNSGGGVVTPPPAPVADTPPAAGVMRVHFYRSQGGEASWGVYSWQGPKVPSSGWPGSPFLFTTADGDGWGKHVDIPMDTTQTQMNYLISSPNAAGTDAAKDCASGNNTTVNLNANLATAGQEIWVVSGVCTAYSTEPPKPAAFNFSNARAVWLTSDTFVWPGASSTAQYQLTTALNGGLTVSSAGVVSGYDAQYPLTVVAAGFSSLPSAVQTKYPQYASATVLKLSTALTAAQIATIITGEVAIVQSSSSTTATDGTQLQLAPLLDSIYSPTQQSAAQTANLGVTFAADVPTFSVWAPTAKSVTLNIYPNATATTASATQTMTLNPATGIWSYTAPNTSWTNSAYYTYSVKVYSMYAAGGTVVTNTVADPYSVSLNGLDLTNPGNHHSMVLNLADSVAMPTGWNGQTLPATLDGTDSAIYELHLRDFSASDSSVSSAAAGKFAAFASANNSGNGMMHLSALAQAGLTHVHLLPAFEFATVDQLHCSSPTISPAIGAATSAATAVVAAQKSDCFNWGYDPLLYGAPQGSYSSNPNDGTTRVREFRDMVLGLHSIGLRVIMDVVYNHTTAAGQNTNSILDQIVPGYYYRLGASGNPNTASGAGPDLATENAMTEKLMIDTLARWASQYKVDGFRFDIMSLIPKQVMLDTQAALNQVALADGRRTANGPGIYLYGEGWGQSGLSFVNAQQANMAGTGIGTFNDRIRDAVRGGSPFDNSNGMVTHQGFINGLCYDNNDGSSCNTTAANLTSCASGSLNQQQCLFILQNRISVGLAGNLASFPLNSTTTGAQVDYFGSATGYTGTPQENIAYISVHDNETVFDVSQYKHPIATTTADRARAQVVGLSIVALAQGVPFFHGGDDMLRSKSMDSNSYDSGDYFNLINWSGSNNNWAVGAPPQNTGNNATNLSTMTPFLNNTALSPVSADISSTTLAFQDFLRIRKDSSMFRLKTAAAISSCVSFPDQGAQQAGLIVMKISGASGCGDSKYKSIIVLFNANKIAQNFTLSGAAGLTISLHPLQANGSDARVKTATFSSGNFSVPARTTAVFVQN